MLKKCKEFIQAGQVWVWYFANRLKRKQSVSTEQEILLILVFLKVIFCCHLSFLKGLRENWIRQHCTIRSKRYVWRYHLPKLLLKMLCHEEIFRWENWYGFYFRGVDKFRTEVLNQLKSPIMQKNWLR